MKTLLLIRHAKSDWGNLGAKDYDRVLNARGLRDAPEMGKRLKAKGMIPELFISSTAKRAELSSKLITEAMGYPFKNIGWFDSLYLASPNTMMRVIADTDDSVSTLALLAHNPGITELAEKLSGQTLNNMPTSAVVTLTLAIEHWEDAYTAWQLQDFDYPKR